MDLAALERAADGALTTLVGALVVLAAYRVGRYLSDQQLDRRRVLNYAAPVVLAALLGLAAAGNLGTHGETDAAGDSDPLFGRSTTVRVVDYEATGAQRLEAGVRALLVLALPGLVGVYRAGRQPAATPLPGGLRLRLARPKD